MFPYRVKLKMSKRNLINMRVLNKFSIRYAVNLPQQKSRELKTDTED